MPGGRRYRIAVSAAGGRQEIINGAEHKDREDHFQDTFAKYIRPRFFFVKQKDTGAHKENRNTQPREHGDDHEKDLVLIVMFKGIMICRQMAVNDQPCAAYFQYINVQKPFALVH